MKLEAEAWVVPVCDKEPSSRHLIPKIYSKRGFALSGGKAYQRRHRNAIIYLPVRIATDIDLPDCDNCVERFKCYTER